MSDTLDLMRVLHDPTQLEALSVSDWNRIIRTARGAKLLSRLAVVAADRGSFSRFPEPTQKHLLSAKMLADRNEALMRWELRQIARVLDAANSPVVLLKGAAYLASGLETSRGRTYGDTDILVPKPRLDEVEALLKANDWEMPVNPRDEAYFRTWMHEVPPMRHRIRRTILDLHHSILPATDSLRLNPDLLFEETIRIADNGHNATSLQTLSNRDMALHSAAHLFRNGDFHSGLRDLLDLDCILRRFSTQVRFWETLVERAEQLDLGLPMFCGLRFAKRFLQTPVPVAASKAFDRWKPSRWKLAFIDRLVARALERRSGYAVDAGQRLAANTLAYWPLPRLAAMRAPVFWLKRLPAAKPKP